MSDYGTHKLRGIPVNVGEYTTGDVWYVDSGTGTDGASGGKTPSNPFATLDYAIGKCTASNGDIIYVMPGHAETTSAIAVDVAGISILGIGNGNNRPTFTASTAASDLMDVTAAGVRIENIILKGAASGVTALIDLSAAADYFVLRNCRLQNAAAPLDLLTITPGANWGLVEDCYFLGTVANLDRCIAFENSTDGTDNEDWVIRRCIFNATESSGCDEACIEFKTSSGGVTGILIEDCTFLGLGDGEAAIDPQGTSSGRATGLVVNCKALVADATDTYVQSDLLGYIDCHSVVAGDHSSGSMLSTERQPATTPNP